MYIRLNNLTSVVETHNLALGETTANISRSFGEYNNIGGSGIGTNPTGSMKMTTMDNMLLDQEKIDFIKMDVEGYEYNVLKGGKETIKKFQPVIMLEVFDISQPKNKHMYDAIEDLLDEYGYHCIDHMLDDYIFVPKDKKKEDYT